MRGYGGHCQGCNPVSICAFPFSTEKWGGPPTLYHGTKSISQVIFHILPLSTNTDAPNDKIKT